MSRKKREYGVYKRESLVTVEMDSFEAALFAPERLKELEVSQPGILARRSDDVIEERYIVVTRRTQGTWEYEVEHRGVVTKLPADVMDRFIEQRKAIIKEGRSDAGRNRLRIVAEDDQEEAALEPTDGDVAAFLGKES